MKFTSLLLALGFATQIFAADAPNAAGLQLYSLRSQFKLRGVPWTLDRVKEFGIKEVELAGTYDLTPEQFKTELEQRGLKAISSHFPYSRYKNDLDNVVKEAKTLGLKYAGCAWIDHKDSFDEAECRDAIAVFNKAGEALAKEGITMFYHAHGFEFEPYGDGTLLDLFLNDGARRFVFEGRECGGHVMALLLLLDDGGGATTSSAGSMSRASG